MTEKAPFNIAMAVHPEYVLRMPDWEKFRYILRGGDAFIEKYVEQFSDYEESDEFARRKRVTPVAGFAKAAVTDVKNSIYQRMDAIVRKDGSETWRQSIEGKLGGVDLHGSSMNHFIGTEVLPELLAMGRVGVYIDNHRIEGRRALRDRKKQHPYLYTFVTEDIRNWEYFLVGDELKLKKVLLRVRSETLEPEFALISDLTEMYRLYWVDEDDRHVYCVDFNAEGTPIDEDGNIAANYEDVAYQMELDEIPFIIVDLQSSLLEDIANHQIALTNLESADISYALRSNVPFYVEQYDQKFEHAQNQFASVDGEGKQEITLGDTDGRRYPIGADAPSFIHPSPEPLQVSMDKQRALKDDIRQLINLALSNIKSRFASAESKELDERGLESGLSAIGLELENAERRIATLWHLYENKTEEVTIYYPRRYSLKSDEDRRRDAKQLSESAQEVSSPTFRRVIQKQIADILLSGKISDDELRKIMIEIDRSTFPTANPDQIRSDVEVGLVSRETASIARGYPEGEAVKARKEKEEMELLRMKAQSPGFNGGARGTDVDPEAAKKEKQDSQDPDNNPDGKKLVRGESKLTKGNDE